MNRFLQLVAEDLYKRFGDDLSQCYIVFPSRRAHLYFSHYLGQLISKPVWSPKYSTINEFFIQHTELQVADTLHLNFLLYEEYKKFKPTQETFDQFYYWGLMLLADFDDIDKYLVDPAQLFCNIKDLKELENDISYFDEEQLKAIQQYWKVFNTEKLGKHQEFFIDIWKVLLDIYQSFRNSLSSQGLAYDGMVCREVAEKIKQQSSLAWDAKSYIFIGFNALNECEKMLFRSLMNQQKALFYWDYDEYYTLNMNHEAGRFIRDNLHAFPNALPKENFNHFIKEKPTLNFYSLPSQTGQAKLVSPLLRNYHNNKDSRWDQSAVVLADEQLLLPVLHAIPDEIEDVNVTMGYPVRSSGIAGMILLIAELRKNIRNPKTQEQQYYHRNVKALLNHPFLRLTYSEDCEKILYDIIARNKFYIASSELFINPLFSHLFHIPAESNALMDYLLKLLEMIIHLGHSSTAEALSDIEKENIYTVYIELVKLKDILLKLKESIAVELIFKIITQILNNLNVPYEGEPLKGLQVMGLLETRTLDFDNVILLSMNEGILPKNVPPLSFVPYNLRKGFGLPTIENQDSIFAYYFYRLIQRAKSISLVYNSNNEKGIQSQEMSRFLLQLKYEAGLDIKYHVQTFEIKPPVENIIRIEKNEDIMAVLHQFLDDGKRSLSPSAISKFIDCPIRFYYSYIAGISEPEEVEEEIDDMIMGNVLHKSLESIYTPFIDKTLTKHDLEISYIEIEKIVTESIHSEYYKNVSSTEPLQGRNIIIHQVISKYIQKLLEEDAKLTPFTLLGLEKPIAFQLPVIINGKTHLVQMKGKLDRLDELNGCIRIIDYKTGQKKEMPKELISLFDNDKDKRNTHVMQLLCYAMMYEPQTKKPIIPGIYYMRGLYQGFEWKISVNGKVLTDFSIISEATKKSLADVLAQLFNPMIPFEQSKNKKGCEYCSYSSICLRN